VKSVFKLILLENKKFRTSKYIKGVIIANIALFSLIMLVCYTEDPEGIFQLTSQNIVEMINVLVNDVFLIFSASMLARYIIGEYSNKTINIMFTYPIQRKKIIYAKLLLVCLFITITIFLSNIFIMGSFYLVNLFTQVFVLEITLGYIILVLLKSLLYAVAYSLISCISLLFGMMKKSQISTIVSSVIIVSIIGSSNNGFSLSSILAIPIILASIGFAIIVYTFRNIERVDI